MLTQRAQNYTRYAVKKEIKYTLLKQSSLIVLKAARNLWLLFELHSIWGVIACLVSLAFPVKLVVDHSDFANYPVLLIFAFLFVRIILGMLRTVWYR